MYRRIIIIELSQCCIVCPVVCHLFSCLPLFTTPLVFLRLLLVAIVNPSPERTHYLARCTTFQVSTSSSYDKVHIHSSRWPPNATAPIDDTLSFIQFNRPYLLYAAAHSLSSLLSWASYPLPCADKPINFFNRSPNDDGDDNHAKELPLFRVTHRLCEQHFTYYCTPEKRINVTFTIIIIIARD